MAEYIEDPQIAASIDDLKRRWPVIGDAADHPLTEFFLKRQHTKRRLLSRTLDCAAITIITSAIYCVLWYLFPTFIFITGFITGSCVAATVRIAIRKRRPRKEYNLLRPDQFLSGAGDKSQWQQIRMLPLTFRDIIGINLACEYHKWLQHTRSNGIYAFVLAMAVLAGSVFYLSKVMNIAYFAPCLLFLMASINQHLNSAAGYLKSRMCTLQMLAESKNEIFSDYRVNMEWFDAIMVFAALINFVSFTIFKCYELMIDISILAWGCIFFFNSFVLSKFNLDARFSQLIRNETPRYEAMLDSILNRGSQSQ